MTTRALAGRCRRGTSWAPLATGPRPEAAPRLLENKVVHKAFGSTGWREVMSSTTFKKSLGPDLFDRAGRSLPESSMHLRSQLKKMIGHGEAWLCRP